MQRIYIQISHLRFKRCKGFPYNLVVSDSKDSKDLHRNLTFKIKQGAMDLHTN